MENKSKYTPGPYGLYENKGTAFMTITRPDKDGIRIVGLAVNDPKAERQKELESTAAIFKAAPELLAALERMVNNIYGTPAEQHEAYEIGVAAIAKARGE